jgi:hypothetical protein
MSKEIYACGLTQNEFYEFTGALLKKYHETNDEFTFKVLAAMMAESPMVKEALRNRANNI